LIYHEAGDFWVGRTYRPPSYTVYRSGVTHSTPDSSYPSTADGLSLAIARCDYLHKAATAKVRKSGRRNWRGQRLPATRQQMNWANLPFQFAKTMPNTPHWYVRRTPENETDYVELFHTIAEQGVVEKWGKARYRYWYPGDGFKYWAMTTDVRQSRIINRAKVEEPKGDEPKLPQDDGV
jgi:hypothetical protein